MVLYRLSTLGSDGRWSPSEIDYTSGCQAKMANWPALVHWERIGLLLNSTSVPLQSHIGVVETLAAGWRGGLAGAEQFQGNPDLRKAISSAMNAWFSNDFNRIACLDFGGGPGCACGTPGFWNKNWFSNVRPSH